MGGHPDAYTLVDQTFFFRRFRRFFRSENSAVFFGGFSGAENSAVFSAVFQMIFQAKIVEDMYRFLKGNVSFWKAKSLLKWKKMMPKGSKKTQKFSGRLAAP